MYEAASCYGNVSVGSFRIMTRGIASFYKRESRKPLETSRRIDLSKFSFLHQKANLL